MFGSKMSKVEKAIEKSNAKQLISLADDSDQAVRLAAIKGLGSVGGDDTSNYLITRLQNPDPAIRIAIAQSLGMLADVHTKAHLSAQMTKEQDPQVREVISKAMSNITDS